MVKLSKEAIKEFKEIYKKEFGEEISDREAYDKASNLLRLFEAVYKPIPKDKQQEFKKICEEEN